MSGRKSSRSAIARRYARALFEAATEKKVLESVEADMKNIAVLVGSSAELRQLLKNPTLSRQAANNIFTQVTAEAKLNRITADFAVLLGNNRRLGIIEEIQKQFEIIVAQSRGELEAEVTSAVVLNSEQKQKVAVQLKSMTGKKVNFSEKVDKEILGGLVIKIGSQMLDNSIKGKLERLKILQKQTALPS